MIWTLLFLTLGLILCVASDDLVVKIQSGQIKGRKQETKSGNPYYAWQGIPFARPPVGNLRFQAPQPATKWSGIKQTTKNGPSCHQVKNDGAGNSEDCLSINVFAPVKKSSNKLPVMFWVYGGAFRGGSSGFDTYGPDRLIQEDVIIVTSNYRLGPFGFLSTGDTVVPGNAGLKDQVLALQWTHDNIAAFGGDPNKITTFGESAGSASVGYLLLSPLTKGLFRGAIQQSGSPLNDWASMPDPKSYVASLINIIDPNNKVGTNSQDQLKYLQSVDASKIAAASKSTTPSLTLPVLEVEHSGAFLTQSMYESFESGNFNKVPVIIGCNSEEMILMAHSTKSIKVKGRGFDGNLQTLIPGRLQTAKTQRDTLAKLIKNIYLQDNQKFGENDGAVVRYESDNGFTRGIIKQGELMSKYTNVYFYVLSYDGELGGWNKSVNGAEKVQHGEDLHYLWTARGTHSNEDLSKFPVSDQTTSKRMVRMWTNFAKNLNPTPGADKLLQSKTWPTVIASNYQYMDIDTDLEIKVNPKASYIPWKQAYERFAQRPYNTY